MFHPTKYRTVSTLGLVTDKTAEQLKSHGWRSVSNGLWVDPQTGKRYTISEAAAIRQDRLAPRYRFRLCERR